MRSSGHRSGNFFDGGIELESLRESKSLPDEDQMIVPRTLLSSEPIRDSKEYSQAIRRERYLIITILCIIVLCGPLVFRYCLGCRTNDNKAPIWGGDLDYFEVYILLALFSNMTGAIIRLLPVVCGGPATIESVKQTKLEGEVALCVVAPFCAEGDEMLLRSMLGRTCTLFHTISSRHVLHGLYVDVTMNEKRLKGEANRKKLFFEWMGFLTTLIKICQKNDAENGRLSRINSVSSEQDIESPRLSLFPPVLPPPAVIPNKYAENNTNFKNRFNSFRKYGESVFDMGRDNSVNDFAPGLVIDAQNSIQLRKPSRRKSTVGSGTHFRRSTITHFARRTSEGSFAASAAAAAAGSLSSQPAFTDAAGEGGTKRERDGRSASAASFPEPNDPPPGSTTNYYENLFSDPLADDRDITHWAVLNGLVVNIESIEPVINFFDQWLSEMKLNERIYHYGDKNESLDRLFLAAPFIDHFIGEDLLAVHTALDRLYVAFTSQVPDDLDPKKPIYPDDFQEVEWTVKRKNSPDWTVVWGLIGRSKLRPMTQEQIGDSTSPPPLFDVVQIIPGAIVYCKSQLSYHPSTAVESLMAERKMTYKVLKVRYEDGICVCDLTPFPPSPTYPAFIVRPFDDLSLIEMNRGKAGALNFCNEYFRRKTSYWTHKIGATSRVQSLVGIVDARHALVEPHIFWNDALPFFSSQKDSMAPSRSYGFSGSRKFPVCITVQYPQHFSNVGHDDFLDNSNCAYYNIWQPLRDCGKCVTSSGTNTIWDISDPLFLFCTDTRSEDLGTSHKYISDSVSVYLCSYVAYGIAKKTEDYLEALYRWAAGPLELMWLSLSEPFMLWNYFVVIVPCLSLVMASFSPAFVWYYVYLGVVAVFLISMINDKRNHRKPLRRFVVSTVICSNLWGWVGTFFSITWVFVLPLRVAAFGQVPFLKGQRWFFWGLATLVFGMPLTLFNDSMIRIARLASKDVHKINLYKALWRGSQLYACSFAYNMMAIVAGSYSAFKAWWYKRDLSLWSSFRISGGEMDKAWARVVESSGCQFWIMLFQFLLLKFRYLLSLTTIPTEMTRLYICFLFICQIVFVIFTVSNPSYHNYVGIIVVIAGGVVNICLIYQVAYLLEPRLRILGGFPVRPEILYAYVGVSMVIAAIFNRLMSWEEFFNSLHIRPDIQTLDE